MNRRTVLVYGTFDGLCPMAALFLRQAAQLGEELIVGCRTDAHCADHGLRPRLDYASRRDILKSCRFVDRVIEQSSPDQMRTDIVNYDVDVVVVREDFDAARAALSDITQVAHIPLAEPLRAPGPVLLAAAV